FIDHHGIEKGSSWMTVIREAASTSQVMVVVLSPSYPLRHWCMVELDLAMKSVKAGAKITIIPVYYGINSDKDLTVKDEWKEEWAKMQDKEKEGVDVERWEKNLIALKEKQGCFLRHFADKKKDRQTKLKEQVAEAVLKLLSSKPQELQQRLPVPSLQPMHGYVEDLRPGLLNELKASVLGEDGSLKVILCVHGEGGLGKTVLARAVALDQDVRRHFTSRIIWVSIGQKADILDLQAKFLHDLDLQRGEISLKSETEGREAIHVALKRLHDPCLIVLDDVWAADAVTAFACDAGSLPQSVRVLVTTRSEDIAQSCDAKALMINGLTLEQSLNLIAEVTKTNVEDLKQIETVGAAIEKLGGNTLGVQLVSRLVAKSRAITWSNVLGKMEKWEGDVKTIRDNPDLDRVNKHHTSVFACLAMSLDDLRQNSEEVARDCLRTGTLAAGAVVPLDVLRSLWAFQDDVDAQELIDELASRHLILPHFGYDESITGLSLHSLQAAFYAHKLRDGEGISAVHEALLCRVRESCLAVPEDKPHDTSWVGIALEAPYMGQHMPHHLLGVLQSESGVSDEWLAVSDMVLDQMIDKGQYFGLVEDMGTMTLAVKEKALGVDHPDYATTLHNLARLLHYQGKYAAAEPLYRGVLAVREKALGVDHPKYASTLNNLAGLLLEQGKYDAAEPLYRRALEVSEKALGVDHPKYAATLNNLANLLEAQGKYDAAEPLYRRALAIRKKALGVDHPKYAATLNNLANLFEAQGKYDAAEPLYRRALAVYEKALGVDHPDYATMLNNLAELFKAQGKYDAAEPLYRRALAVKEKALGVDHPDYAATLHDLAELLKAQGKYDAAEPLYRRALAVEEKALGVDHPEYASTQHNLAGLLKAQEK
ncbi:unnamed protein product, partial [Chrysoparadoxa australica]